MASFFGGIVAQEIIKYTGKYSPLQQWFHYDNFQTLPRGPADRTPMNSRYDDQILVYGREIQEKLTKINAFIVGAGAIGCEYLKTLALMGVGCSSEGKVTIADKNNIKLSNLNRKFLFCKDNVGDSKCDVARGKVKEINPNLNLCVQNLFVG